MPQQKTLLDRLAELTTSLPSADYNPDAPEYDDGTGAGLAKYETGGQGGDDDVLHGDEGGAAGSLRVSADMENIGHEYSGKRVSREELQAESSMVVASPEGSHASDESDGKSDEEGDEPDGAMEDETRAQRVTQQTFPGPSSTSGQPEQEDGEGHDDDTSDASMDEVSRGDLKTHSGGASGSDSRRVGQRQQSKPQQSNVFARVGDVNDVDAEVEQQMMELEKQDARAKRQGGGRAGEAELKRAREALRQRQWWDSLLEVRILLQRLMNAANKLPGPSVLPLYLEGDESLATLAQSGADAAQGLAERLSVVRRAQMEAWGMDSLGQAGGEDDDEGTDVGGNPEAAAAVMDHERCATWWEKVIGRWHERTQLVDPLLQKKFRVVNQSPWVQVTASLADRDRANRRSFLLESETSEYLGRSLAKRLKTGGGDDREASGAPPGGEGEGEEGGDDDFLGRERRRKYAEPVDLEVLDDRQLYQHLLKEFMDASGRAGDNGAPAGLPMRRKTRKNAVDRRASKGRKIKYVTHPKMQNFMFPQEYAPAPMEPSELFASLFGGAGDSQ